MVLFLSAVTVKRLILLEFFTAKTINETTLTTTTTAAPKGPNILEQAYEKTVELGEDKGIPKWGTISILIGNLRLN